MAATFQKIHYNLLKQWGALRSSHQVKTDAPLFAACVFKNEAPFLKEWIDFHLKRGVQKFYLSDNGSTDNFEEVMAPYVKQDLVSISKTPFTQWSIRRQAQEFNRLVQKIKGEQGSDCWVAFIDIDEYLFSMESRGVRDVLNSFAGKEVAAVQVNWLMFGTSGLKKLDKAKPMIEQLTKRAPMEHDENTNFKPIAYLANTFQFFEGPHLPIHKGNAQFYFSDGSNFAPSRKEGKHSPLRLNHYWYRAEEDYYQEKVAKREAYGDYRNKELEEWHMNRCNEVEDLEILKLKDEV
ncbi:glycosyltransferase family 92 protein [Owenweeksia hongkongensis]|uniref:glycosyltransferase family 92 protein n=1 Tax=Owenweeksia hongkongensis TaxID=253245 RepID=UPI003A9529D3